MFFEGPSGHTADVTSDKLIYTKAVTECFPAHISHSKGDTYGVTTPELTLTTTGGRMLYLKNTEQQKNFYLSHLWINYDGGSTSHDEVAFCEIVLGDTAPTTNTTPSQAGSLNQRIGIAPSMDVSYWDEVGDGMTGHTPGNPAFYFSVARGGRFYNVGGMLILGLNNTISFNAKAQAEAGEFSVNLIGYFLDRDY